MTSSPRRVIPNDSVPPADRVSSADLMQFAIGDGGTLTRELEGLQGPRFR